MIKAKVSKRLAEEIIKLWQKDMNMRNISQDLQDEARKWPIYWVLHVRVWLAERNTRASELMWTNNVEQALREIRINGFTDYRHLDMNKHIGARKASHKGAESCSIYNTIMSGKQKSPAHDWHIVKPVRNKR